MVLQMEDKTEREKKTQLLLIRQTKQRNLSINLELFGEKLINTDNTKLLGVTLT